MSVQAVQAWFEFNEPRTVYKWQSGEALPSVDNLFALSELFGVSMNEIIVRQADPNRLKEPMKDGSVFLPQMAKKEQKNHAHGFMWTWKLVEAEAYACC